jgi:DNA modification methylase
MACFLDQIKPDFVSQVLSLHLPSHLGGLMAKKPKTQQEAVKPEDGVDLEALLSSATPGKLRLSELIPCDDNPRDHDPSQIDKLIKSIKTHGYIRPIMVQVVSNRIVAGHGTRLALLRLAKPGTDPIIAVMFCSLTDEQARSYAIADNRLTDLSSWNMPILRSHLAELDNGDFDMESLGFTADDLAELFNAGPLESSLLPGVDPDDAPPLPQAPETRRGDLLIMGQHRLLCGDSTSMDDWDFLLQGEAADLVVTDPPYGVAYQSSAKGLKDKGLDTIKNDDLNAQELEVFLKSVFLCAVNHAKKHAAFYVFYASRFHREFENALNHAGLETRAQIIWVKNAASFGFAQYKWKHEPCLLAADPDAVPLCYVPAHETAFYAFQQKNSPLWEGDRAQTTVWAVARETGLVHPTQKPIELIKKPICNSSKPRMLVVDPFGGSGSTLMTCEVLGRRCCTMDLSEGFCDVIKTRWENATGKKATLVRKDG